MIGSESDALNDSFGAHATRSRFGGPLAALALLLVAWVCGRSVLWESPFPGDQIMAQAVQLLAETPGEGDRIAPQDWPQAAGLPRPETPTRSGSIPKDAFAGGDRGAGPTFAEVDVRYAVGHHSLWTAALTTDARGASWRTGRGRYEDAAQIEGGAPYFPGTPPFVARKPDPAAPPRLDRWSLGAWAFVRQGSRALGITPGPAPVYGASQIGANLQYRVAPRNAHDPSIYVRAARALIDQPETEVAAGFSVRPIGALPVRAAAEVRATDNSLGRDIRPAVFAITQVPPVALPLQLGAEVYGAAGYVGGEADTGFVDAQATLTRDVARFDLRRADAIRVSVGAGAWGGAQRGAHRIDVGPTFRVDMAVGAVPARFSIDYRERVGGDALPVSGLAATLSTQF